MISQSIIKKKNSYLQSKTLLKTIRPIFMQLNPLKTFIFRILNC